MTDIIQAGIEIDVTGVDRGEVALKRLAQSGEQVDKSFERGAKAAKGAGDATAQAGRAADKARGSFSGFTQETKQMAAATNSLASAAGKLGGVLGSAFALNKTINAITAFEDSILRLQATSNASADAMAKLEKQARTLGATSSYSAGQAADAQNFLAMAGLKVNEIMAATPSVMKFASAASIDLARSADIATNVLGGMQLPISELERTMNAMVNTAQSANTDINQLGSAFAYAAPLAVTAAIDVGTLSAAIGALGDAGIQGSRAGTGMVGVIRQLSNATPEAQKALATYGLTMADVDIKSRGLVNVLDTLKKSNLSTSDAMKIFGSESASAALILSASAEKVRELADANEDAAGKLDEVASILDSSLSKSFAAVKSAIEEFMLQTGDRGLTKTLKILSTTVAGLINNMNGMLPEFAKASGISQEFERNIRATSTVLKIVGTGVAAYGVAVAVAGAKTKAAAAWNALYALSMKEVAKEATLAAKAVATIQKAIALAGAAMVGWQIGTYLREEFEIVEKAGIALMSGLHQMAVQIHGAFKVMGENIKFAFLNPLDAIRREVADLVAWIAGLGTGIASAMGFDTSSWEKSIAEAHGKIRGATAAEHEKTIAQIKANTAKEVAAIGDVYADMFAEVGKSSNKAGKAISGAVKPTKELGDGIGGVGENALQCGVSVNELSKALKELEREQERNTRSAVDTAQALRKGNDELRREIDSIGKTRRELVAMERQRNNVTAAALKEAAAVLDVSIAQDKERGTTKELIKLKEQERDAILEQIELIGERNRLLGEKIDTEEVYESQKEIADQWKSLADDMGRTFTDAIIQGGASAREAIRRMFVNMVLRPIVEPIMRNVAGMFASMMGGSGGSTGGSGSGLNLNGVPMSSLRGLMIGGTSLLNHAGVAYANMTGTGIDGLLSATGGYGTMPGGAFSAAMPYLPAVMSLVAGDVKGAALTAAGAFLGSFLPIPGGSAIGSFIGSIVGGLFGGSGERFPRTVSSSTGYWDSERSEWVGTGRDKSWQHSHRRQFGDSMEQALGDLQRQFSVRIASLLEAFGVDESISTAANVRLRRTSGRLASWFSGTIGDEEFKAGGEYGKDAEVQEAFEQFVNDVMTKGVAAAVEASPLAQNIKDIFSEGLGLEQSDFALDALIGAATGLRDLDRAPAVFQRLESALTDVIEAASFGDLSDAAGEFAVLNQSMTLFYDAFTSDADKLRDAQNSLLYAFEDLGVEMPRSIDEFYRLADAQDLSTDAGRELFNSLMELAPGFLSVSAAALDMFEGGQSMADALRQGLLGTWEGEDIGTFIAGTISNGVYNAIAGQFANQITDILLQGIVAPMINAALTGASISEAVSRSSIDAMVAQAQAVAQVAAEVMGALKESGVMDELQSALSGGFTMPSVSYIRPAYTPPSTSTGSTGGTARVDDSWKRLLESIIKQTERAQQQIIDMGRTTYEKGLAAIASTVADYQAQIAQSTASRRKQLTEELALMEQAERRLLEAQMDQKAADLLAGIADELERLGKTDAELAIMNIEKKTQDYINSLQDVGRATAGNIAQVEAWSQAMKDAAAKDAQIKAAGDAYDALSRAVESQRSVITEALELARDVADAAGSAAKNLFADVLGASDSGAAQARAFIADALSAARNTGYLPEGDKLREAIDSATRGLDDAAALSTADANWQKLVLANQLRELADLAEPQVDYAQGQLDALDSMLQNARDQLDVLQGIDNSVLTVAEALSRFNEVVGNGQIITPESPVFTPEMPPQPAAPANGAQEANAELLAEVAEMRNYMREIQRETKRTADAVNGRGDAPMLVEVV